MHFKKVGEVYRELDTSEKGLSESEAKKRLEKFGPNKIKEKKKISPWKIFFQQFNSIVVYILIAAVIISIFIGFTKKMRAGFLKNLWMLLL